MEWLGHAKIGFINSPNPISIKSKDGSTTDLLKICEESTPPCRLNPLLFNGNKLIWEINIQVPVFSQIANCLRSPANHVDSREERRSSHIL